MLCLAPAMTVPMSINLPLATTLSFTVLTPAAGDRAVMLWVTDGGNEIPGTRVATTGAGTPQFQTVGPIPLAAGPHDLSWISGTSGGTWPVEVGPFHLGEVLFGQEPVSLTLWCGEQDGDSPAAAARSSAQDDPAYTLFTGFEQTGILYFLRYIPWLDWSSIDLITYIRQSSQQVLNGSYSAEFVQVPPYGASTLWSREIVIPSNSSHVTLVFGAYFTDPNARIGYKTYFDDTIKSDMTGGSIFTNTWYRVVIDEEIPPGARQFKFEINLVPLPNIPLNNSMFMDDLLVDFGAPPPPPTRALVFGDLYGNVYGLDNQDGTQQWKDALPRGYMTAQPAIASGAAYITANGTPGLVQARNAQTGALVWSTDIPAAVDTQPAVVAGIVYVCAANGTLYGLDQFSGQITYTASVFSAPAGTTIFANLIVEGVAYITTTQGLYAFDVAARTLKWEHPTAGAIKVAPAIFQGFIYYGRNDGVFEALRCDTGAAVFPAYQQGSQPIYTTPQLVGGMVVFGTDGGVLVALNATSGTVLWTIRKAGMIRGFLVLNDRVYLAAAAIQGTIYCLQFQISDTGAWTFTDAWSTPVAGGLQQAPLIDDQTIYFTGGDRHIYALAAKTGAPLWNFASDGVAFMTPAINELPLNLELTRRYDQCCYLCAHNAYANTADGWLYAQQTYTLTGQLNDGVRAFMLDASISQCAWTFTDEPPYAVRQCGTFVSAPKDIYMIHENLTLTGLALLPGGFTALRTFTQVLREIAAWLNDNPNEVVTILLESQVNNPALMQQTLQNAGVGDLIFWADRPNQGPSGSWNVETQGWPTLEWMVNAHKRLVLLSQHRAGSDGLPDLYRYAVENDYGDKGIAPGCNPRRDSRPLNDTSRALFVMNYFVDWAVGHAIWYPFHYGTQNDFYSIMAKVNTCAQIANRLPNFVSVDYYQRGDNGGPKAVVDSVNQRWKSSPNPVIDFQDRAMEP